MNNEQHKPKLISTVDELMSKIDSLPLHPKNTNTLRSLCIVEVDLAFYRL